MSFTDDIKLFASQTAVHFGIDPNVFAAQIEQESSWNPFANSDGVHIGLGQFDPPTAARFGLTDRTDPYASITAMAQYDAALLSSHGGDYVQALQAYGTLTGKAGPGSSTFAKFVALIGGTGGGIDNGAGLPSGSYVDDLGRVISPGDSTHPTTIDGTQASSGPGGIFDQIKSWLGAEAPNGLAIIIGLIFIAGGLYAMLRR